MEEFTVFIPTGQDPIAWCQPHTIDHYCDLLDIPELRGEYGRAERVRWDRNHKETHKDDGTLPHHHIWLHLPDGYVLPAALRVKLQEAMSQNDCIPQPIWYTVPIAQHQITSDVLQFPGRELVRGLHRGVSFISSPDGRLGLRYCCYECKKGHDGARCQAVLAKLPDPGTRPKRLILEVKKREVPLARPLVLSSGQIATHEIVNEEVLEDKAAYEARILQWLLDSKCWD